MYYQGVGHAFRTIIREEGFWGLYKGLGATLLVRFFFLLPLVSDQCLIVYSFLAVLKIVSIGSHFSQYLSV